MITVDAQGGLYVLVSFLGLAISLRVVSSAKVLPDSQEVAQLSEEGRCEMGVSIRDDLSG